jgi:transposase
LINAARGLAKGLGGRLPKCSTASFPRKVKEGLPAEAREMLLPLVELVESLGNCIRAYDDAIERLGREKYPQTKLLRQVKGVGPITSLAYLLTLENPERFKRSRDVGPYLGLVPKQEDSGERQPQLRITKMGDMMVRRLLVGEHAAYPGSFRARHGFTPVRFATERARGEECKETSGGGGGAQTGGVAAPSVGERRGI